MEVNAPGEQWSSLRQIRTLVMGIGSLICPERSAEPTYLRREATT